MKRFFPLLTVLTIILSLLCSCSKPTFDGVKYTYEDENLEITFPKDMKVFDMNNLNVSDTDIEEYGFEYSYLKELADPEEKGLVFMAKRHDKKAECSVYVTANDYTIEIWDFTTVDSAVLTEYATADANAQTTNFYTIMEEDEYRQDNLFFIRFDMASSNSSKVDTIYLFTIKNGLKFSFVYYADDLTEKDIDQAKNIFDSIQITKNIEKYTDKKEHRLIPVVLILATIIVIVIAVIGISSIKKQNRKEKENGPYQKQFQSILDEPKQNTRSKNNKNTK